MRSAAIVTPEAIRRAAAALAPLIGALLLAAPVWAGDARLVDGASAERVVVETRDAGTDEVLAVLAAHFGFAVEGSVPAGQPVRLSGRLEGSLDDVLGRLLRHQGHMIVRSAAARAGISRVLLIAPGSAAPPLAPAAPMASIKAKMQARERREGEK